jgi:hypothetical protein
VSGCTIGEGFLGVKKRSGNFLQKKVGFDTKKGLQWGNISIICARESGAASARTVSAIDFISTIAIPDHCIFAC